MKKAILLTLLVLSSLVYLNAESIYYVRTIGTEGNDGLSWNNPCTLSKAISSSVAGDEIRVGAGVYPVASQYTINKNLVIKGSYTASNTQDYSQKSILDGNSSTRIMAIINNGSVYPNVTIDGFQFINGFYTGNGAALIFSYATGNVRNCEFKMNNSNSRGAAITFLNSSTVNNIINCSFFGNWANNGGAICGGENTQMYIRNSTIANNYSTVSGNGILSLGTVRLFNSIVTQNINSSQEVIISKKFRGMGSQLGGYDNLVHVTGSKTLSQDDWTQLYNRLLFMKPGLVRIAGSQGWNYMIDGVYNPSKSEDILFKILDFCQANDIDVIWAEWGHVGGDTVDTAWLSRSIDFLDYLVTTKEYSCVKYFTMVNEPNGSWSTIQGNFTLYSDLINKTYTKIVAKGLDNKIKILAPDITITRDAFIGKTTINNTFLNNTVNNLDDKIGAYAFHLYPANDQVEDGDFLNTVLAYRRVLPANKDALIAELGFSYYPDSPKGLRNIELREADSYASDNANMMVYESIYGIDIATSIIQLLMAGYNSALVWRLDDAMYMTTSPLKTTRWGFWNSLGTESFNNSADENLRPWFYPTSLLSKFFPKGSTILNVNISDKPGIYAIACKKDEKYTIAIVNTNPTSSTINFRMCGGKNITAVNKYVYTSLINSSYTGIKDVNGFPLPSAENITVNLSSYSPYEIYIDAKSFVLLTNM